MTKAERFAMARKATTFSVVPESMFPEAQVNGDGDLYLRSGTVPSTRVPELIKWLQEIFLD